MSCSSHRIGYLAILSAPIALVGRLSHSSSVRRSIVATVLPALAILFTPIGNAKLFATAPTELFFSEDFNSDSLNPNLTGYEKFALGGGVIRRNGVFQDGNDRRYMRTTATNYNEVDFRFELTFTTSTLSETSINYMGIGSGDRRPGSTFGHNEAWESLHFRVHTPNVAGGYVGLTNHPATDLVIIGAIPSPGTHRGRIEKVGNAITFAIDANFNGNFVADMTHTFPDLTAVAPFLNSGNSRLFFGTVFPNDSFDNMLVVPEPASAVTLAVGAILLAGSRRRRTPRG